MSTNTGYPNLFTNKTLSSLTEWAHTQPRNVEHFLEEIKYPAVGKYVHIDDDDRRRQNRLQMVYELPHQIR